jgi:hypothetical protein
MCHFQKQVREHLFLKAADLDSRKFFRSEHFIVLASAVLEHFLLFFS